MKKFILATLAMSVFLIQSAFAQNLGALSDDQAPQGLVSATEFSNFLSTADNNPGTHEAVPTDRSDTQLNSRYWYGYGSYYYPYYYPYYYYPYYSYGGYYNPWWYSRGRGHYRRRNAEMNSRAQAGESGTNSQAVMDRAHVPVVCFAQDNSGHWYGHADIAARVQQTQDRVNHECLGSGGSCSQNLGCALAVGENQ